MDTKNRHYRPKKTFRTINPENDPDQDASLAQNPVELEGTRIDRAYLDAAGIPAMFNVARYGLREMGPLTTGSALLDINQERGFDCQSCAWPSPDHGRKIFEFCENGARAAADELTKARVTPAFFARNSVQSLAGKSDYWLNQQGRLTEPMIKYAGSTHYRPISWDGAFTWIANELNSLQTPDEASFYTSGKTMNEPAFLLQLFARQFGTNNLPDCSNMCHESSGVALTETLGVGKGTVTLDDLEHSDLILVFGNNPGTNHPRMLTSLERAKRAGARIIAVNPLPETGLMRVVNPNPQDYPNPLRFPVAILGDGVALADLHLPVRVNGDVALVKAILKYLLEEEAAGRMSGIDRAFIERYTLGFGALQADVMAASWDSLLNNSGLTMEQIRTAGALCAASKRTICCWATGLTQQPNGVDNVAMVVNLLLVGGHIGRPGAGTCCVRGHSNVQGDRTMGVWERPSSAFLDALDREFRFHSPRNWGLDTVETIHAMRQGTVKILLAISGNFVSNTPDTAYTAAAISRCRLTVHVSTKLNRSHLITGDTAIILPCLGRAEKDRQKTGFQYLTSEDSMGIVNISQGREKPASPHLLSDVAIIARLAQAVLKGRTTVNWLDMMADYGNIRQAISRVIPGFENFNNRIEKEKHFYLPNSARDRLFQTPSGKAQLTVCPLPPMPADPNELLLMTVRSHDQFNSTIYGKNDRYRGVYGGRRVIFLHPEDMRVRGLTAGCLVDITSHFEGEKRHAQRFLVVPYTIAKGCAAAYYPETNVLVPIGSVAAGSNQPAYKHIRITLAPSVGAPAGVSISESGIEYNLARPKPALNGEGDT